MYTVHVNVHGIISYIIKIKNKSCIHILCQKKNLIQNKCIIFHNS